MLFLTAPLQHLLKSNQTFARVPMLIAGYRGPTNSMPVDGYRVPKPLEMSAATRQAADAERIFTAGVEAVSPLQLVRDTIIVKSGRLLAGDREYRLERNVHIAAFGKAVVGMVCAAEECLGGHIAGGVASVPVGLKEALRNAGKSDMWPSESSKVKVIEGAMDNMPDDNSLFAARQIKQLAEGLSEEDILLVLLSGGGSALLPAPIPPITLEQKRAITTLLAARGASIQELNVVRTTISSLKGGKLALLARPAKVICLILSDIVGDPIELIASGPTVRSRATSQECLDILAKYTQAGETPDVISDVIARSDYPSTAANYDHVNNIVVGSNRKAVAASVETAETLGYLPIVLSTSIVGEAKEVGKQYAELTELLCTALENSNRTTGSVVDLRSSTLPESLRISEGTYVSLMKLAYEKRPICLVGAGETTVTIQGNGQGGRNQEMALAWALAMDSSSNFAKEFNVTFLCGGTDGQDGPTDAAGAWVYPGLVAVATANDQDAEQALKQNDSYSFFAQFMKGRNHLKIGLTGTNVMDVQLLLVGGSY